MGRKFGNTGDEVSGMARGGERWSGTVGPSGRVIGRETPYVPQAEHPLVKQMQSLMSLDRSNLADAYKRSRRDPSGMSKTDMALDLMKDQHGSKRMAEAFPHGVSLRGTPISPKQSARIAEDRARAAGYDMDQRRREVQARGDNPAAHKTTLGLSSDPTRITPAQARAAFGHGGVLQHTPEGRALIAQAKQDAPHLFDKKAHDAHSSTSMHRNQTRKAAIAKTGDVQEQHIQKSLGMGAKAAPAAPKVLMKGKKGGQYYIGAGGRKVYVR